MAAALLSCTSSSTANTGEVVVVSTTAVAISRLRNLFSFVSLLGFVLQLFLGISPKRQKAHPISLTGNEIRLVFFLFDFWVAKGRD